MSLDEHDFWKRLEYRICEEFAGYEDRQLRYLWCDGLTPVEYTLNAVPPLIRGTAWIGDAQDVWQFTVLLPHTIADRSTFDWSTLLPIAGVTAWMTPELDERRITIEPSRAIPDDS